MSYAIATNNVSINIPRSNPNSVSEGGEFPFFHPTFASEQRCTVWSSTCQLGKTRQPVRGAHFKIQLKIWEG